ncbi:MAG: tRNA preQ1(34) S-adenosylmethionine ribosyltransferase-isomerase QueA [Candidatus Saganbacteria bacterium]|nr:tRNA preQ1(34) S-adenosylmethionine ribosyltransferase-isomerase QueA [Candidatus Saganbacteria bacterium]
MLKTSNFDYNFPDELIAHEPSKKRDQSRLMVLDSTKHTISHKHFSDILDYLKPGDLLVLNDTKVIPARLFGTKVGGGARIEVLLIKRDPIEKACGKQKVENRQSRIENRKTTWECLVKPGKRLKVGSKVRFGKGELVGTVIEKLESGEQIIEFVSRGGFWKVLHKLGKIPLPPYINTKLQVTNYKKFKNSKLKLDKRYQTVYANRPGASAAPTAGLHFTPNLLKKIKAKGVKIAYLTLHTGLATFLPVRVDNLAEHKMHSESFAVPPETIKAIKKAKRVIAVGTTVVRALESSRVPRSPSQLFGETNLFIYPGYKFKTVDAMITNFHWPRSTLIMLVSAFAGKEFVRKAYKAAIRQKYRFFSFGDAMLIV